ncbi:MAG: DMT family protein [Phycisphaerales bacterium]
MPPWITTVLLLIASNVFMTYAWYYHLKMKSWTMLVAIGLSWGIALFEYCLQVPANRIGHIDHGGPFTAPQLKILQEGITLTVFGVFSIYVLQERLRWTDIAAFALIFAGVMVGMLGKATAPAAATAGQ